MPNSSLTSVDPDGWRAGPGYSHATVTDGRLLHVAAIAGLDARTFEFDPSLDLLGQWRQALENLRVVVAAAGASMTSVAMLRMYVVDIAAYRANEREVGRLHREFFGGHLPAATLLGVAALGVDEALVEIEAIVELGRDERR